MFIDCGVEKLKTSLITIAVNCSVFFSFCHYRCIHENKLLSSIEKINKKNKTERQV